MHNRGMLVNGQELARPDVVLGGAHGDDGRPPAADADLAPVVIEAADRFLRVPITQDRALEIGVQRLEVQSRKHGLRGATEVDGYLVGHASEASATVSPRDGRHLIDHLACRQHCKSWEYR